MWLTKTAINRPIFIFMLVAAALLMGYISLTSMNLELNPSVNFPVVTVQTQYPGASPDDVNQLVTKKIEDAASSASNIQQITSTSQEGLSTVVIQFNLGTDVDNALNDVKSKVDAILNNLPTDVLKPEISKFDNTAQPVLYMSMSSNKSSRYLRDLVDNELSDKFAQIDGVASVGVQGGDVREIEVQLSKDKLMQYGIGILDVQRAVANSSLNAPSGQIVEGPRQYTVRVKGDYTNVNQIKNTIVTIPNPTNPQAKGSIVRLSQIANVLDTSVERTTYSRLNGKDTIVVALSAASDGNAVSIVKQADKVIAQLQKEYAPIGLKITKTYDQAQQIEDSITDVQFAIAFGVFLVAVIVFVFLHNFRGTLIVSLAIPTSIFASFIAMKLLGFTINNMTMLSLSLGVGVLLDDAIVVLENIYRHLKLGEPPKEAALNGRMEIGLAALAITFADVVVFAPIGFMGGIVGQFFRPLAFTFVAATLFSLFISFTLTPLLAARWYKVGEDMEHPVGRFAISFERGFSGLERFYRRSLEWALRHRWFVFIVGNVVLVGVFMFIGGSFAGAAGPLAALKVGIMPLMLSILIGLVVSGANAIHGVLTPNRFFKIFGVISLIGFLLGLALFRSPGSGVGLAIAAPLVALAIFAVISWVVALASLNVRRFVSLFKYVAFGALFGLAFPIAGLLGAFARSYVGGDVFKFAFLPDSDAGQIQANIELAPGASLAATQQVVTYVEHKMEANPNVRFVVSNVGNQGVGGFSSSNDGAQYAQVLATLYDQPSFLQTLTFWSKPPHIRELASTTIAAQVADQIGKFPGAFIKVSAASTFNAGSDIQLSFTSDNQALLVQTAAKVRDALANGAIAGVVNPDVTSKAGQPELDIVPNRTELADLGIDVSTLGNAVQTLYQGNNNVKLRQNGREYDVRVMMDYADRNNPTTLNEVPITFNQGNPIFLPSVSTITEAPGVDKINRFDRAEQIEVTADLLPGYANGSVVQSINNWLAAKHMVPAGVNYSPQGQANFQATEQGYIFGAMGIGLVLVYMLLASLYDNLLYPFIIQIAQPQAIVGALVALMITQEKLNIVAMIGLICLIGLVGKNAILLVDYTNTLRSRGRNRHDALVEAGPTRLRPILMTTMTLVLGMLPVALAIGRGSEFRQTIGTSILGGMLLSTVLTLLVIPCSYTIFDDLSNFIGAARGKPSDFVAEGPAGPELGPPEPHAAEAPVQS